MSVLAIIPARSGSKEILQKNIKLLSGKPLIAWTIEAAKRAKSIDKIIVSTDSDIIAKTAKQYGAEVPFLRPPELSQDESTTVDTILHAIEQLPNYDWVLLLQPTSPLRTASDIDSFLNFCQNHKANSTVSICKVNKHPYWMYTRNDSFELQSFVKERIEITRRQDLPSTYSLNGALYLVKVDWFLKHKSFINEETKGYLMSPEKSVDIDNIEDWNWAEYLINQKK
jgi:CMP-N,N'-diacetyllegionaminic acid synthase